MPFALATSAFLALLLAGCPTPEEDDTSPEADVDVDRDGWTVAEGDCDDGNPATHPGATERVADGIDQDCDGGDLCYEDADEDGYGWEGTIASEDLDCSDPWESALSTDPDDEDAGVYPSAPEIVADGIDQDGDGGDLCYQDADGDGYGTTVTVASEDLDCTDAGESAVATDCDDANPSVHPGAEEGCGDGVDDDCDGLVDCDDPDCVTEACPEDCEDGFDNDADGLVDCEDGDCYGSDSCIEDCFLDGDEDGDGLADCEDDDCWYRGVCKVSSRVREGAHVWWLMGWYTGRGSATSIDGTLWLQPRYTDMEPSVAVPCTWHADHAHFGFHVSHVHHYTLAWANRTGFVLSSACPLPDGMSAFLPAPLPRWGHVYGWAWTSVYAETVYSWYVGPMVTLGTYHYSGSRRAGHWSIAPVETGNTFTFYFFP